MRAEQSEGETGTKPELRLKPLSGTDISEQPTIRRLRAGSPINLRTRQKQLNRTNILITSVDGSPDIERALKDPDYT